MKDGEKSGKIREKEEKNLVFITFVGTGMYSKCKYYLEGNEGGISEERLVQKSICKLLQKNGTMFSGVLCLLTKNAKDINWERYYRKDRNTGEEITEKGLRPFFEDEMKIPKVKAVDIPDGHNAQEILKIFKIMFDSLNDGDEIVLDATHGFRFLPMLYFPLVAYAKALKNITVRHIYYGVFETKEERKPILDLKIYDDILNWANASHEFVKNGNAGMLSDLTEAMKDEEVKEKGTRSERFQILVKSKKTADLLKSFTQNVLNCRGGSHDNKEKSIAASVKKIKKLKEKIKYEPETLKSGKSDFAPLDNLLDYALNSVNSDFKGENCLHTGVDTIRWCIDKNLTQQGLTALRETYVTMIIHKLLKLLGKDNESLIKMKNNGKRVNTSDPDDEYVLNFELRNCVESVLNEGEYNNPSAEEESVADAEKECIKVTVREIVKELDEKIENKLHNPKKITVQGEWGKVRDARNDMNHFGMRKDAKDGKDFKKVLEECFQVFEILVSDESG